ncbi:hypothetical protein FG386_001461 [Cryptosporidium ryanae]|uniref:uncharacterized protein n=1 Tax=Cryptosporidium ryanae TaxID=515981 RepID=UPI003519F48E|nr:hypothetical protein FG386_001461 [Cryptosporidium ryanae]
MKFIPVIGDPFHLSHQNRFLSRFKGHKNKESGEKSKLAFSTGIYTSRSPVKPPGYDNEDSYCVDKNHICVADGVGGWITQGISSAMYSRELIRNVDENLKLIRSSKRKMGKEEFIEIINNSYEKTKSSKLIGSSTLSIVLMDSSNKLHVFNLGDSKCLIYRMSERSVIYESDIQQHDFNIPYQLGTGSFDKPKDGQYSVFENVKIGDTIILATDGLWDNLSTEQIIDIFEHNLGLDPQIIAEKIGQRALRSSLNLSYVSPYSVCIGEFLPSKSSNSSSLNRNGDCNITVTSTVFNNGKRTSSSNIGCGKGELNIKGFNYNANTNSYLSNRNNIGDSNHDNCFYSNFFGGKPDDITVTIGIINRDASEVHQ